MWVHAVDILTKHVPGSALSPAEFRQRRDAARARWAGRGAIGGAVAGGLIGGFHQAVTSAARAEAAAHLAGIRQAHALDAASLEVTAQAARRRAGILAAIQHRRQANPQTRTERAARQSEVMRAPQAFSSRGPVPPVVGTKTNARIYEYLISGRGARGLGAQLLREKRHLARMTAAAGDDTEAPDLRRQRARVAALEHDVAELRALATKAPRTIARAGSERGSESVPVSVRATTERKFRRGETNPQVARRISQAKAELTTRQTKLLAQLERTTAVRHQTARERVLAESAAAIRTAFERGEYQSRILRASGRGAVLGAGIGLTLTGLGILAHHVAAAGGRTAVSDVAKAEPQISGSSAVFELAQLRKAKRDGPEDRIGTGLAMTFRRWIDRLLGNTDEPMNLGDGITEAMAPGITEAYAAGLRTPPIQGPDQPGYHIDVDFDVLNPSVRRHMAEYALDRIVQITDAQREAIRDAILKQSVLQGIGPKEVARTIQHSIGLTAYQRSVVESFQLGLVQLDPRVLGRKLRDRRYDRTLRQAIETNTPLTGEQIAAMTDAYHRRMLALRARTIARTEALRATSFGGLARAQQVLDEHPELDVTKRWLATDDERTRDTHRDLNGREVDGMQTAFITTAGNQVRWPLDENAAADETINCRCTLQYVFKPKRGQLIAVAA